MIGGLAAGITLLACVTAVAVLASILLRRYRRAAVMPTLGVLQVGLTLQAVCDVVAWARGHRPGEPATHAAYLVASLLPAPLVAIETRHDDGLWSALIMVVSLVVVAVIVVRMQTTWR